MKNLLLVVFLIASISVFGQTQNQVQLDLPRTDFSTNDTISFNVSTQAPIDLEVAVFSNNQLFLHENSRLNGPINAFRLETSQMPVGFYYVLVTGEGIHEQKSIKVEKK